MTLSVVVVLLLLVVLVVVTLSRTVRIVPQARAGVVERLGRYQRTLNPGLTILLPFVDNLRPLIDLREQVVSFPPQPVITEDNLVVSIDTVIYFQVTDPKAATYEIANYIVAVEQLTVTTLRNVVGGLNLEQALTSRDQINSKLRLVLDEATGRWGIRVNRVELKAIDPPPSIQDSMEQQMRAERTRRAQILTAEGTKAAAVLTAEGQQQATILKAEGDAQAMVRRAEGEAQAIARVFGAVHEAGLDEKVLAYQYLQMLPQLAQGSANKVWVLPSEIGEALKGVGSLVSGGGADGGGSGSGDAGRRRPGGGPTGPSAGPSRPPLRPGTPPPPSSPAGPSTPPAPSGGPDAGPQQQGRPGASSVLGAGLPRGPWSQVLDQVAAAVAGQQQAGADSQGATGDPYVPPRD